MNAFRRHFRFHPRAAAWLLAATLLMKLLVPAGFMPVAQAGTIRVALCTGYGAATMTMSIPMDGHHGDHGKPEAPCEFSALGGGALVGNEPVSLTEPMAFPALIPEIPKSAFGPLPALRLRPPLRGPPAT